MRSDERVETECVPGRDGRRSIHVARSAMGGRGVFIRQWYKSEEILGELTGTVIDDWLYGSSYCMDLGDSRCLEPDAPFRFLNHSCEPNCYLAWFDVSEGAKTAARRRMFLIAQDDIPPGAELTIDYAWPATKAIRCHCQAAECRGWVVAEEELAFVYAGGVAATAAA